MSDASVGTGRTVLVVEDTFLMAQALVAMLGELGYAVAGPAGSSAHAHRILDREHVDAALLDVNLRGELVTEVADRLTELRCPFVFLTAYDGLDMLPAVYHEHVSLSKPCTSEALAQALEDLF